MIIVAGTTTTLEEQPRLVPSRPSDPPVAVAPLSWVWRSWTGQEWNLTDWSSPLIKLKGATGLGQVDAEHWWADSPTVDGSTHNGLRVGRGSVFLPLMVRGVDSADFLAHHREFIRSLDPGKVGVLRVTSPDGTWREQVCRYESGADLTMDYDPVKMRQATYGITWATADPYWTGEPVSYAFEFETTTAGFFPGPPFQLGLGLTLNQAEATNPGDVPAFPVWRVNGPFTSFTVGVGASVVSVNLSRAAGQWVEVDMDPRRLTIRDQAGVDRWDNTTDVSFEPIPPGEDVPVVTNVVGAALGASVQLSFTPRYRRAW